MISQELLSRARCTTEVKRTLVNDAKKLVDLCLFVQHNGIVSIEDKVHLYVSSDFGRRMFQLLCWGTDGETITELGITYLINSDYTPVELFKNILFLVSALSVQEGNRPKVFFEKLQAYFGYDIQLDINVELLEKEFVSRQESEYIDWLMKTDSISEEPELSVKDTQTEEIKEPGVDEVFDKIKTNIKLSEIDIQVLNSCSPEYLVNRVINAPPLAALCILYLNENKAVQLLNSCDEHTKAEIFSSMMQYTNNDLYNRKKLLIETLEQLKTIDIPDNIPYSGIHKAAHIINKIQSSDEVLDLIKEADVHLYNDLKNHQYIFTDILNLNHKDMSTVLKETGTTLMAQALCGTDDTFKKEFMLLVRPSIFVEISEQIPKSENIDYAYKKSIQAQNKIVSIVNSLGDSGEIVQFLP